MKQTYIIAAMLEAFFLFALTSSFSAPLASTPSITDADWTAMNKTWIWSGKVWAITKYKGCLYVAGELESGICEQIGKWDGKSWDYIDLGRHDDTISALAFDSLGNLYAGGCFDTIGGIRAKNIAQWNGKNWTALGSGFLLGGYQSGILALACDKSGTLYAGGYFSSAGGVAANSIAKWDGNKWTALGSGVREFLGGGSVWALALDSLGNLYAGGSFDSAGSIVSKTIAKWNGTSWDSLGSGIIGGVFALAIDPKGNLYAAGEFDQAGGKPANGIAQWNGTSWNPLGYGLSRDFAYSAYVYAICFGKNGILYAGGKFTKAGETKVRNIAQWDGSKWDSLGSGADSTVNALAFADNGDLFAGSYSYANLYTPYNKGNLSIWNGDKWNKIGLIPLSSNVEAIAVNDQGIVFVGGKFSVFNDKPAHNITKLDGNSWDTLDSGANNEVKALALDNKGNLYAGGFFNRIGGKSVDGVAAWNGDSWKPYLGGFGTQVLCLAIDGKNSIFVGGQFIYHINVGDSLACRAVYALTIDNKNDLYAAADSFVAKWDGVTWEKIGPSFYDVCALAHDNAGNIYAGCFLNGGVFKWDGVSWTSFGYVEGRIYAIVVDNKGNLYAGGDFLSIDNVKANNIARWDGSAWSTLGSGTNGTVNALSLRDSTLYVGGRFGMAGKTLSGYIAKVNIHSGQNSVLFNPERLSSLPVRFHISHSSLVFSNNAPHDRISLYSLSGRWIRQVEGVSAMNLTGIAPQPLFIRVSRAGKIVSTGMVMAE